MDRHKGQPQMNWKSLIRYTTADWGQVLMTRALHGMLLALLCVLFLAA